MASAAGSSDPNGTPSILLVTGSLLGGGAERVLAGMANYWARAGLRVALATWSGEETGDAYALDRRVERLWLADASRAAGSRRRTLVNVRRVFRLRALIRARQPTVVLSFITTSNVLTVIAAMGLRTRVAISERIDPSADPSVGRAWSLLRRCVYRFANVVVVQSGRAADWIAKHCRCSAVALPNPLRTMPLNDVPREHCAVAVGRLARQKGFDVLLRAFAEICEECAGWALFIVGEGTERAELEALREELGLRDRVTFVGHVKDVETWMARAGIVVQPSRFEGFPNVLLESMAMGAPVISSDCPSGPSDIIEHGVNGLLVPVEDVGALAAAMRTLMTDDKQRRALGRAAMAVRKRFDEVTIMRRWEQSLFGHPCTSDEPQIHEN